MPPDANLTLTYRQEYKRSAGSINTGLIAIHNVSIALALLLRANELLRNMTASKPVVGGENQFALDEVGLRAVPYGQSRTVRGVTVCSVDVHAVTIFNLWKQDSSTPSISTLCSMRRPRNDSLIAIHFNGPELAKKLLVRVWNCWHTNASLGHRPRPLDASCRALGIQTLERVPVYTDWHMDQHPSINGTYAAVPSRWAAGHFPWWHASLRCHVPSSPSPTTTSPAPTATRRSIALLMTVDHRYEQLVPAWAAEAQGAGVGCILGVISSANASQHMCAAARRVGCHCLADERAPRDQVGSQVFAVKIRFDFARRVLRRGLATSLLMHDADVFFRPGGLVAMTRVISALPPTIDFAVSDNGPRRNESFDDLNWGVAWVSGSNASLSVLDCVLAEWTHPSFERPSSRTPNPALYFQRSQPRINHILEAAIVASSNHFRGTTSKASNNAMQTQAPRVCTFERRQQDEALRHMTGMSGAHAKLVCARAENVSRLPPDHRSRCVLSYSTPLNASARAQMAALKTALQLRNERHCTLALPAAMHRGKRIGFCKLFDPGSVPLEGVDAPIAAGDSGRTTWLDFETLEGGERSAEPSTAKPSTDLGFIPKLILE